MMNKNTRNNVNQFFSDWLLMLCLQHGIKPRDMLTTLPLNEVGYELFSIYLTVNSCNSECKKFLRKYYFENKPIKLINQEMKISHDTSWKLKIKACNEFASKFVEVQEQLNMKPVMDLRAK